MLKKWDEANDYVALGKYFFYEIFKFNRFIAVLFRFDLLFRQEKGSQNH